MTASTRLKPILIPVLAATVTAMALSGCAGRAGGTAAVKAGSGDCPKVFTVKYHAFPSSLNNMIADVAQAKGMFKQHCVDAVAVNANSAPAAFSQSVSGTVNLVNTAPDNVINSRSNGLDVVIVGNQFSRLYYSLVVSSRYSDLKGKPFPEVMKFLSGKKIGVTVLGGNNEFVARSNFRGPGLDPNSATYVALGASASSVAALSNGTVDAAELYGNAQDLAVAKGLGFIVNDTRVPRSDANPVPEDVAKLSSALTWAAQRSFAKANPAAIKGFMDANADAVDWIKDKANRAELYTILAKESPIPADVPNADGVFKKSVDIYADQVSADLDTSAIVAWLEFTKASTKLKRDVKADELVYQGQS
jgi:NitT/TauT family transport system substrate-binding protein